MADLLVLEELMAYLIAQGAGQDKNTAVSSTLPSVWLLPRDGAPLPRTGEGATVTLGETLSRLTDRLEPWLTETFVDVTVRATGAARCKLIQRQILNLIVPFDSSLGGRKNWDMGALRVECSDLWRGDQPMPQRQSVGETDPHVTFDRVQSFRFLCRRKTLAGLSIP
jgi:hypothetical protein